MSFESEISSIPGLKLIRNYPASLLCSFRVGGVVAYVLYPQSLDALQKAVSISMRMGIEHFVVGRGTNILPRDEGYSGAWIVTEECNHISFKGNYVDVACGMSLARFIEEAADRGLGGIENLYGIPGSVGGAVYMNCGAYGQQFSDVVVSVDVYEPESNKICRLSYNECSFSYRYSLFQERNCVILNATLRLGRSRTDLIRQHMNNIQEKRSNNQPLDLPSAGSAFKRPFGTSASRLITECGLSGYSIGGAMISPKHNGFIVNSGGATAQDIKTLIQHVQAKVFVQCGVMLEPEIKVL